MKNEATAKTAEGKQKVRRKAPIKIVLRRLPRGLHWEELRGQLDPLPETEYEQFVAADPEEKHSLGRAYFVFKNDDDIVAFRDRFNGYVFVDSEGNESMGIVELAPNPKVPRHKAEDAKKRDRKCGTIENDVEYKRFLEERENPPPVEVPDMEARLKEIEAKEKAAADSAVQETPLTMFLIKKNEEKFRKIQERRRTKEEERRLRLQRMYENEKRERTERKEAKKVTEFRNSKFDRARDLSLKERKYLSKENKETEKSERTARLERVDEERTAEREATPEDRVTRQKTYDEDRATRQKGYEEDRTPRQKAYDRPIRIERPPRKERSENQQSRERNGKPERGNLEKKERAAKVDSKEEVAREPKTTATTNREPKTWEPYSNPAAERSSKPSTRIVRTVVSSTVASKAVAERDTDKSEKADTATARPPRRNKDRPERAIYQPSAARRRMAAAAAAAAPSTGLDTISEAAGETTEKRDANDS